jgi:hypothetical protein
VSLNVSQIYVSESDWLRFTDLSGPTNVTIVGVEMGVVTDKKTGKKRDQLVLTFDGWDKKLGLNKTNAARLATLLGDDANMWVNHTITLYIEDGIQTENGGTTSGIRVLPMLPGAAPQQPKPRPGAAPYNLPPVPHTAVGNTVQGVVNRAQQRRPAPPPVQSEDDYGHDPLA